MKNILAHVCLFPTLLFAQTKNDLKENELIGKVRSVRTTQSYRSKPDDRSFGPWTDSRGSLVLFTPEGRKEKVENYSRGTELFSTVEYSYTNSGLNALEITRDKAGKLKDQSKWKLNAAGLATEAVKLGADNALIATHKYLYDAKGFLTNHQSFLADGSVAAHIAFTNDPQGRKINEQDLNDMYASKTFAYDAAGNMITEGRAENDNMEALEIKRSYDAKGNLIKEIIYLDGAISDQFTFSYVFDTKGNWIKKTKFNSKGEPFFIQERKIVYY